MYCLIKNCVEEQDTTMIQETKITAVELISTSPSTSLLRLTINRRLSMDISVNKIPAIAASALICMLQKEVRQTN
jgi:hypothetical protein